MPNSKATFNSGRVLQSAEDWGVIKLSGFTVIKIYAIIIGKDNIYFDAHLLNAQVHTSSSLRRQT